MKHLNLIKQAGAITAALAMTVTPCFAAVDALAIAPVPGPHGYFVDTYQTNSKENLTPETNAVVGILSPFLTIWEPGDSWNNGKILGDAGKLLLNQNIQTCITITKSRTKAQELTAYLTDRRNQNYTALDGLGPYETTFKTLANAATSLPAEIPADALAKKYSDKGNENGSWADTSSSLGGIVDLLNTVRGPHASGNPAKIAFQYMRPFRWSDQVSVIPALKPCISDNPMEDGGFPSGHTNAGYLASLSLAYSVPERFQECLTNASEIGNSRIVAGMHSPMDVMGGRIMATALAAAALNDPANAELKAEARKQASELLLTNPVTAETTAYDNPAQNKSLYVQRLTYGFPQTGDTQKPMLVPKGAEVLLETRFPYLSNTQRRWVLYSTGLPSGYAFLDDAEGWGRLNLYDASSGYGAFFTDVAVHMDAEKGGFSAYDVWNNPISGEGSLSKNGSGTLVLAGNNSYTGGVHVNEGLLITAASGGFGYSSVNNKAAVEETVNGTVLIHGDYNQNERATLKLDITGAEDTLKIGGTAQLDGILQLDFSDYPDPESGMTLLTATAIKGQFTDIQVTGLNENKQVVASADGIIVTN